jgi:hypothetical protein
VHGQVKDFSRRLLKILVRDGLGVSLVKVVLHHYIESLELIL